MCSHSSHGGIKGFSEMKLSAVRWMLGSLLVLWGVGPSLDAFVIPMTWEDKCIGSDAIIRGEVVELIQLPKGVESPKGSTPEKVTDAGFSGPHSVAVVRVTDVVKTNIGDLQKIIFIPCGYDFDESPAELTKAKDYILFLRSMGENYFHPMDYCSTHRVQKENVGLSGLDTDADFIEEVLEEESVKREEFVRRIIEVLKQDETREESKQKGDQIVRVYKVSENYRYLLAEKAFQKTGKSEFKSPDVPEGHSVVWEPSPRKLMKELGLEIRRQYSTALSGNEFTYYADAQGHEEFIKFNESLGIKVQLIEERGR